ncbi:hypothetical protein BDD43_5154 [Mucilaginibacter gracilis]|uniref:Uncharacterized protein n=1 Tax=Mucilaginibacter gracilis TaxID=423350 RepID=A0A495J825_9SPHI|nr:hypothetical protein [Mucilaginibacter gracilis]RKR84901.1 hypothetical protein BDD43_5154 [Mucilaginibacter gracilis]
MQNAQLLVNDIPLDLPSDSLIALSYAVNTLADLKTVQGNISNSINLPNTAANRAALGYPEDLNFNGVAIIRQKLACRYIQNGVDVIPQGNLRITGASKSALTVVLSCGNTDFFDVITGKITDLDLSEYDHLWNMQNVIASRLRTDGYIYPFINYGNITNDTSDIRGQGISPNEMRPAVFAKTLVDKIVASAGYTLINKITDDPVTTPIYNNLILPFSADKISHPQRYIDQYAPQDIEVQCGTDVHFVSPNGVHNAIPFNQTIADTAHLFDGINWTADRIMRVDINAHFPQIHLARPDTGGDSGKGAYFKIMVRYSDGSINKLFEAPNLSFVDDNHDVQHYDFNMTLTGVPLKPGDQIYLEVETAGHGVYTTVDIYHGATLTIKANNNDVIFGEQIQLEGTMPDMNCTDFLKFISFLFCAIIQTDNVAKTVTIVPFGYILQQMPNAIDWSAKVTEADEDYDVQIGDYYQQNEAKFAEDDAISPATYGNGSFYINDFNLDIYQDIYDIPFAASYDELVLGNNRTSTIKKIADYDTLGANGLQFTISTTQRILLLNKKDVPVNYRWDHDLTPVSDSIPFAYFASGNTNADLTMTSVFNNHYADFINVLADQRKLTCYLQLNEIDIQTLNFFKPVYIQKYASYFYISKITDFTGVKPCKVELIRL